jgi:phospholipid/cholesterol/gamma-HCH transport system ATP-binding protein
MSAVPIFRIRGLHKSYGSKHVLAGLDFDILRGECLIIMGRSGCGKSVTLRQLNGLEKPDAGTIELDGVDITELSERALYPIRRRVAMLFQSGALFDSLSVFENIAFPLREHTDLDEAAIAERVADRLQRVRLHGVEEKMPSELSGGMKRRVALARSLVMDPEVVLFDEPSAGLDPITSATIANLICSTQQDLGVTCVVVTHDLALARTVGDRLAFLEEGRFRFLGDWAAANASQDRLLHNFLEGREDTDAA